MKFSDIEEQNWEQLAPYLDTCLLPLTGLDGTEKPWQATNALEKLRDFLDLIEIPFRGRIVTYPAAHYELLEERASEKLDKLCSRLKTVFRYVIVASAKPEAANLRLENADLLLVATGDPEKDKNDTAQAIARMWSEAADHAN